MYNYNKVLSEAKEYGRIPSFTPEDREYENICNWLKSLPDVYRLKMYSYYVVAKELADDKNRMVIAEFHKKDRRVSVFWGSKSSYIPC